MRPKVHILKTWPTFFSLMKRGEKHFEYRRNDRGFRAGDLLDLREWMPKAKRFTGRTLRVRVALIVIDCPGLPEDYCIMEVRPA